ncbi:MAG TPA: PqqD family protein [Thermoanaerobaculia bacterium]|nr:PqqD family protein [Thermoanaerobaculia bacterium]
MKKPEGSVNAIGLDTIVQVRSDVLFRQLGDEIVALDLESGKYYGLNEVGSRVWDLLQTPRPLGAVQEALLQEYEVPAGDLWRDLEMLVSELVRHGLAEVRA